MVKTEYDEVVCKGNVPRRGCTYVTGQQYKAKKNNPGGFWWVGIPGEGGNLLTDGEFREHFSKKSELKTTSQ